MRRAILAIVLLILLAPVFGWAADLLRYAEPLENAAEAAGAPDAATTIYPGLLPDYTVSGLGAHLGTLASAALGTGLTLVIAVGIGRLLQP